MSLKPLLLPAVIPHPETVRVLTGITKDFLSCELNDFYRLPIIAGITSKPLCDSNCAKEGITGFSVEEVIMVFGIAMFCGKITSDCGEEKFYVPFGIGNGRDSGKGLKEIFGLAQKAASGEYSENDFKIIKLQENVTAKSFMTCTLELNTHDWKVWDEKWCKCRSSLK